MPPWANKVFRNARNSPAVDCSFQLKIQLIMLLTFKGLMGLTHPSLIIHMMNFLHYMPNDSYIMHFSILLCKKKKCRAVHSILHSFQLAEDLSLSLSARDGTDSIMGVFSFAHEFESPISASRLFKALMLDSHTLLPKLIPQSIESIVFCEGCGGVGSIKQTNFARGTQRP